MTEKSAANRPTTTSGRLADDAVFSKDGTRIASTRDGVGEPLALVIS